MILRRSRRLFHRFTNTVYKYGRQPQMDLITSMINANRQKSQRQSASSSQDGGATRETSSTLRISALQSLLQTINFQRSNASVLGRYVNNTRLKLASNK